MDEHVIDQIFSKYLNQSDLECIKQEFNRPIFNPRTQREIITYVENEDEETNKQQSSPPISTLQRRKKRLLLNPSSLKNYKCTFEKFGRFKLQQVGREAPVTPDLINIYNVYLNRDANLKYMTRLTNVRTLNKYIVGPILGQEMRLPRTSVNLRRNNKPILDSRLIAQTVARIWNFSQSEHAYKILLI